jgi:hypothetical protein
MDVCFYSVFVLSCVSSALRLADHPSKESYQLSISVRLRNLIRGGQGPIWAVSAIEEEECRRVTVCCGVPAVDISSCNQRTDRG